MRKQRAPSCAAPLLAKRREECPGNGDDVAGDHEGAADDDDGREGQRLDDGCGKQCAPRHREDDFDRVDDGGAVCRRARVHEGVDDGRERGDEVPVQEQARDRPGRPREREDHAGVDEPPGDETDQAHDDEIECSNGERIVLTRVVAELDDIAGIDETGACKDSKPAKILRLSGVGDDERRADGDEPGGNPGDGRDLASERKKQQWHEHGGRDAAERAGGDVEVAQALDVADVQHEVEHAEHDAAADEAQAVCTQGGDDAPVEHEQQQGRADERGNARGSERRDAVGDGSEDDSFC